MVLIRKSEVASEVGHGGDDLPLGSVFSPLPVAKGAQRSVAVYARRNCFSAKGEVRIKHLYHSCKPVAPMPVLAIELCGSTWALKKMK